MNKKTFNKIVSIISGIAIWAYVISFLDPISTNTIRFVPVELTNVSVMENAGLAIAGSGEYTVDLVIGGNRSNVSNVAAADFIATADVSNLHLGQNYITVEVEGPSHISINEVRTQSIQVYVDTAVTIEEPVVLVADNAEGKELGALQLSSDKISVSGASSLVEKVASVTAHVDAASMALDTPTGLELPLKPVDSEGNVIVGVKLSSSMVSGQATLFETKEIALNVPFEGDVDENITIESETYPASIVVKGPKDILANLWSVDADPIQRSRVENDCTIPITVGLPSGVEISKASEQLAVVYKIKGRVEKTLSISNSNMVFIGASEGLSASIGDGMQLDLSVFEEQNELAINSAVLVFVDVTDLEEGEYDLPVEVYAEGADSLRLVNPNQTLHVVLEKAEI